MAASATAEGSGSGSGSTSGLSHTSPTILSTLHTLLQSSAPAPTPLNHPFAPLPTFGSWKGKSRDDGTAPTPLSADEEVRMLEQLKNGIEAARSVIGHAVKEEGRTKLARAMKEVTTRQSALLPVVSSLHPLVSRPPSFRTPPRPMELLTSVSQRLGIETYLEESQFGLLKTTLAIAGKRFVLDVELEVDSSNTGDVGEGDETPMPTPAPTPGPGPGLGSGPGPDISNVNAGDGSRGKVRLSKLLVNHVTKDGGTADSASIAAAIRHGLEAYLELWNEDDDHDDAVEAENDKEEKVDKVVGRLWDDMSDLASLDALSEESGKDWFAELEQKASLVARLTQNRDAMGTRPAVLPRLTLLPHANSPVFRLRPASQDESVPNPFSGDSTRSDWILEYVPVASGLPGLVVRRNWLGGEGSSTEGSDGIRVEQLLCGPFGNGGAFPYGSEFSHPSTKANEALEQNWSMIHPGPTGYVVGRIGVGGADDDVERLLAALRRQAVLNDMLTRVLDAPRLRNDSNDPTGAMAVDDEDEDDFDFELLSKPPIALPITLTVTDDGLRAIMPLPHHLEAIQYTLALTFTPGRDDPTRSNLEWTVHPAPDDELRQQIDSAINAGREAGVDSIDAVRRIEQALKR